MRDDGVYLEYVVESIERIERYVAGTSGAPDRERLSTDDVTQDAVLRRLETLAEATSHLSSELRERHPTIDWRKVTNFRNVLARGYVELSLDLIWQAITEDLPKLKAVIARERLT